MTLPFDYPSFAVGQYGGSPQPAFEHARVTILPLPLQHEPSASVRTRNGPEALLAASARLETWDEETDADVSGVGIHTLPAMAFPFPTLDEATAAIRRVTEALAEHPTFPVFLGGEHTITGPIVAAMAHRHTGLSVLQLDAHAALRDTCQGSRHHRSCVMRRVLEYARASQVGVRSLSPEEAHAVPGLPTELFYDFNMRHEENWIERVVDSLGETVYITIDVDVLEPSLMPATAAPEPGGLSWYELLALLRRVIESRNVVGCDVVELSPLPGMVAPDVTCAKLIYKILGYKFASGR